jgi:hypothetical protein|tara:strand:+ start:228 stop:464 length:237 start_codon:yes stop_codon:yes gene_type:complete
MSKLKTVYDNLLPDVKTSLQASARKYSSAKRLKYTLMSKLMWQELTIDEMRDVITYSDLNSWELNQYSFMYGENIIER